jgi:glycosyltransferase involved in cell wall biosynthesis
LRDEPLLHVVLVGAGPDHGMLQTAIDRNGLAARVHLLGRRDDVPALLARADVFVLPSRFEGLPSSVIEAMAAARPIVATDVGGMSELVVDGDNGWLVPPAAPLALADAIRSALASDRAAVGAAGRQRAAAMFDAPLMAARFSEIYREVAA